MSGYSEQRELNSLKREWVSNWQFSILLWVLGVNVLGWKTTAIVFVVVGLAASISWRFIVWLAKR